MLVQLRRRRGKTLEFSRVIAHKFSKEPAGDTGNGRMSVNVNTCQSFQNKSLFPFPSDNTQRDSTGHSRVDILYSVAHISDMKKWVHYSEYLRFELWRHNMRTTLNVHLNTCKYKYWNITHNKAAYWWKLRLFTCKTLMNTVNSQTKAWFFYQKVFDIFWSAPICCCMFNVMCTCVLINPV